MSRRSPLAALVVAILAVSPAPGQVVLFVSAYQNGGTAASVVEYSGGSSVTSYFLVTTGAPFFTGVTVDPSGNVDVADADNGIIYQIRSPNQGRQIESIPTVYGLASDPAGNIYAASPNGNNVVYKNGNPFATGFNSPDGLAYGPDADLYVANYGNNTVSKVSPNSAVSTFISGLDGPTGLAFDGIGDLYVANALDSLIDRITPAGVVTPFATLAQNDLITGIAYGPDGNLYAACYGSDRLAVISPAGVVSYLTPSGLGDPVFIAAVPEPGSLALIGMALAAASPALRARHGRL